MAKTFVPCIDVQGVGGIMSKRGRGIGSLVKDREVGKDKEFSIGKCISPGDDLVLIIGDETMALAWVKMTGVFGVAQEKDGNKADSGVGDIEGIRESETSTRCIQADGTYTQRVDRMIAKSFNGVGSDRPNGVKVRQKGRYVTCGSSINDEG